MKKKQKMNKPKTKTEKLMHQLYLSLVGLFIGSMIIIVFLSIRYKTYDYNIPMRIIAVIPAIIGTIIISMEYFFNFNRKFTENDIRYLKRGWKTGALILLIISILVETGIAFLLGLFIDRNGNVLRFLIDSSYSGLFVYMINIITSISVIFIQRAPLSR